MWTNASHRVRGCGRQTGKKLHSEEWKRREENKRQLELNEIKYTRRKKSYFRQWKIMKKQKRKK